MRDRRAARSTGRGGAPAWGAAAAIVAFAALYAPVFAGAFAVWSSDAAFTFAFLTPPLAAAMLWTRRAEIRASVGAGAGLGLLGLLGGVVLLLADWWFAAPPLGGASCILTMLGAATWRYGVRTARALALPCLVLGLGLCLSHGLVGSAGSALQWLTAVSAVRICSALGVAVRPDGLALVTPRFQFEVAEACSGLGPLLALLCLGLLLAGLTRTPPLRAVVLLALIVGIAVTVNILRVTLELALSGPFGLVVAEGLLHQLLGVALFLCALGLLFLAERLLRRVAQPT